MKADNCVDFKWQDLLTRIDKQNVIPVIGEGLYWVKTPDNNETLLYPLLAEKFTAKMGLDPVTGKETFHQVVFRYLEKNPENYLAVNDFLAENAGALTPADNNPLEKLAQIKPFSLFIDAVYDDLLEQALKRVRDYPCETVHYTVHDKGAAGVDPGKLKMLEAGRRSLIFNIYGSAARSLVPAYTEKDILETIVALQKDMEVNRENKFFQKLEASSLLFMGCRYDDWLFRFFIRTMTNKEYDKQKSAQCRPFIGDDFAAFNCGGLTRFLKAYGAELYYSDGNRDFVDRLFAEMTNRFPADIISKDEFPRLAFISFHGKDREAAKRLAANLKADGLPVWLDEWQLQGGDLVDEAISRAISHSAVFIPIVSSQATQLQPDDGRSVKYHIREWEWAYGQYSQGQNPRIIMPVKIDRTDWMYRSFEKLLYLTIPGGERAGEYDKLRDRLRDVQDKGGPVKQS